MPEPTPAPATPSKRRVFFTRLGSTLLLWAILTVAFVSQNDALIISVISLFGLLTGIEFFRLTRDPTHPAFSRLGVLTCLGYWGTAATWMITRQQAHPMWLDLAALAFIVQGSFLICYRSPLDGTATLQRLFTTLFGLVYTAIFYGFIARILYLDTDPNGQPTGIFLVLFIVMVTKFTDMGAYAFGVLFGKHKMIPHISPAKSWEGFGGAFIGAFVGACSLLATMPNALTPLTWLNALLFVPFIALSGIAGDLAESVIKRCIAIKDSGHALPGIGGILDLTDSLLFTAPLFYFYLQVLQSCACSA